MSAMTNHDDSDVYLARWLYQSWAMLAMQNLGPGYRLPPLADKVEDLLQPALSKIIAQCDQLTPRVWQVPSPWHAALYLGALQHHLAMRGDRVLFRGQRDSSWPITPSIFRAQDHESEAVRGRLFCEILNSLSFNTLQVFHPLTRYRLQLRIPTDAYWAAAQHYGISTDLIDFTTDAAIATFFACTGASSSEASTSSVYVLTLDTALKKNLEIILPPPFATRLYTQRGVFLRSPGPVSVEELDIMELRFPVRQPLSPFHVVRWNCGVVDVLSDSAPIGEVIKALDSYDLRVPIDTLLQRAEATASSLKSAFAQVYRDPHAMWAEYVDFFEDQMYWLAYAVDDATERLRLDVLKHVAQSNRDVTSGVAQMYRWVAALPPEVSAYSEERKSHLLRLAAVLETALEGGDFAGFQAKELNR